MFRPIALFIGLRYTRAQRRNHFISFISLTSIIGIALGVTVLITVLSVMNGFDDVIRTRILALARHVTVTTVTAKIPEWESLTTKLSHAPGILGAAPFVDGQAMLMNDGLVSPTLVIGIFPVQETHVSTISSTVVEGSFKKLKSGGFGVVLGQKLADNLGVTLGDKVTMVVPQASLTPAGLIPRFKRFTVVGIFKVGSGFEYDNSVAYLHLNDAQKLLALGNNVTGIRLKIADIYNAPQMVTELAKHFPPQYLLSDWTREYASLLGAITLEKKMMFLILFLIIVVAVVNLVSTLVMVVTDKKADIAILRTLGATPRMIMGTFIVQGGLIGVMGTLFGLIGGVLLATYATEIVSAIEYYFNVQFLASDIYYVHYLPSKLDIMDVVKICLAALGMSLLATLYPAWTASRIQPAEALRYE